MVSVIREMLMTLVAPVFNIRVVPLDPLSFNLPSPLDIPSALDLPNTHSGCTHSIPPYPVRTHCDCSQPKLCTPSAPCPHTIPWCTLCTLVYPVYPQC